LLQEEFIYMRIATQGLKILGIVLLSSVLGFASSEKSPAPDRISVIGHVPLRGPATELAVASHWRKDFLYVIYGPTGPVTVFDVTNPAAPVAVSQLEVPKQAVGGEVNAIVGTAAVVTTSPNQASTPVKTRTVTVLSFADPERPVVTRQFSGVTAILKDPHRGLIYLTNGEGLWLLQGQPGADKELEQEYDHYVLYSH
jgi:hypothetical protein